MGQHEHKEGRGVLHPNPLKNKPTQPDYVGMVVIEGKHYELSGWLRGRPGKKPYLSLSAERVNTPDVGYDPYLSQTSRNHDA